MHRQYKTIYVYIYIWYVFLWLCGVVDWRQITSPQKALVEEVGGCWTVVICPCYVQCVYVIMVYMICILFIYSDVINESEASNPNGPSDRNGSLRCSEFSFDRGWNMNKAGKPWKKHHQSKTIKLKKKIAKQSNNLASESVKVNKLTFERSILGGRFTEYMHDAMACHWLKWGRLVWPGQPHRCHRSQSLKPDMPGFFEAYDHISSKSRIVLWWWCLRKSIQKSWIFQRMLHIWRFFQAKEHLTRWVIRFGRQQWVGFAVVEGWGAHLVLFAIEPWGAAPFRLCMSWNWSNWCSLEVIHYDSSFSRSFRRVDWNPFGFASFRCTPWLAQSSSRHPGS